MFLIRQDLDGFRFYSETQRFDMVNQIPEFLFFKIPFFQINIDLVFEGLDFREKLNQGTGFKLLGNRIPGNKSNA